MILVFILRRRAAPLNYMPNDFLSAYGCVVASRFFSQFQRSDHGECGGRKCRVPADAISDSCLGDCRRWFSGRQCVFACATENAKVRAKDHLLVEVGRCIVECPLHFLGNSGLDLRRRNVGFSLFRRWPRIRCRGARSGKFAKRKGLCGQQQKQTHSIPLPIRVAVGYSAIRAVCPAQGIGTPAAGRFVGDRS